MALNDIYTTTPGSAVAQTLQEILLRRREEERQAMLDRLAREEQESSIKFRGDQLGLQRRSADLAQKQFEEAQYQTFLERQRRGATPEDIKNPDYLKRMESEGLFESAQPMGPTEDGAPMAPIRFFPGGKDEQEQARRETAADTILSSVDNIPENQAAAFRMAAATGIDMPASFTERRAPGYHFIGHDGSVRTLPVEGGIPEDQARIVQQQPYPDSRGSDDDVANYRITYKDGSQPTETKIMAEGDAIALQKSNPNILVVKAGSESLNEGGPAATLVKRIAQAKAEMDTIAARIASDDAWFFGAGSPSSEDQENLQYWTREYQTMMGEVANKMGVSPRAVGVFSDIVNDPEWNTGSAQQIITNPFFLEMAEKEGLNPNDIQHVARLLIQARGF